MMKFLNATMAMSLVILALCACNSTLSKLNGEVKEKAQKVAAGGKYKVVDIKKDNPHNTAGCECASKLAMVFQPDDQTKDQVLLCIGKSHSALSDYADLNKGDRLQFDVSDSMLDNDCTGNEATFLKVKK